MSLKPTKKSDLDKRWMNGRISKKKKLVPEWHLIVTEGIKTEPLYFEGIKNQINQSYPGKVLTSSGREIKLTIQGCGSNTVSLFYKAKKLVSDSVNTFKHVWLVYDRDDFPAEQVNKAAELCRSETNEDTIYHAIWSNQCIELWYLLHFSFMHSDISRTQYFPKITEQLEAIGQGRYEKNREDMYSILRQYMDNAILNAKKLEEMNEGKTPEQSAPGTKVYELVEYLKPYL